MLSTMCCMREVAGRQLRASGRGRGAIAPDIAGGLGLRLERLCGGGKSLIAAGKAERQLG